MSIVHNERVKYAGTYLKGNAIAMFSAGSPAPLISVTNGSTAAGPVVVAAVVCWLTRCDADPRKGGA